jgi:hypothetical protein
MSNDWFKTCDLLHIPMSLSYKNEYFYKTTIGAVLTIICFFVVLSISLYEIKSLTEKSSFTIITNQYTDLSEQIDFSTRPILFQLIDNAGNIMEPDSKLFEFKAVDMEWIVTIDKDGNQVHHVINKKLNMDKCDKIYNFSDSLKDVDLSKFFCISLGQNLTSYGYFGDMNNGFKGFRVYLNKCSANSDCYNESEILSKLSNIKFRFAYFGLNTNIYNLGTQNLKYQMLSKACSVSTNILKKIYFPFTIGRFNLYNNIFLRKKKIFNYIIANDPTTDFDLDPSQTIDKNRNTLAYFSFNFDGNIIEIRKEVKSFYDTLSFIGNTFNIALTVIKIVNNYYSNKVLFVDIFKFFFFVKDSKDIKFNKYGKFNIFKTFNNNIKTNNNNIKTNNNNNNNKNNHNHTNNAKVNSKKDVLDFSDEIGLNNANANNSSALKRSSNKMIMTFDKSKVKRNISMISVNNQEKKINKKLIYYYLIPLCFLRKHKTFDGVCIIKDRICTYFSIEKFNELNTFKEALDQKVKKAINSTELLKIKKKFDSNDSMDYNDKKDKNRNS